MKRDFDVIRLILRDVEANPPGQLIQKFFYDGISDEVVQEHACMVVDAGLVVGTIIEPLDGPRRAMVQRLTPAGHDFVDSAADDGTWSKVKTKIMSSGGAIAISVFTELLKAEGKKKLGL